MPKTNFIDTEQGSTQTLNSSQNYVQTIDTEFRRNAFLNFVDGACEQTPKSLPRYAFILLASYTRRLARISCIWCFLYESPRVWSWPRNHRCWVFLPFLMHSIRVLQNYLQ